MKALESLIPQNLADAIGATFMHAIWQLAAVALLLLLAYQIVSRKSSRLRYNLGIMALGLMFALPIGTFGLYYQSASPVVAVAPSTEAMLAAGEFDRLDAMLTAEATEKAFLPGVTAFFNENAALLFSIWMIGAFLFTLRFLGSYIYVQRLRRRETSPVPEAVLRSMQQLKDKLGITRTVQLLQSGAVDTPMVIGVLRPVILLPVGLLSGLSPEQVQCILAHELAHIRRWDYLVNIFQSIVEICLFFHPAVWWVSKMVREERENCCDETVLALKNNSMVYAKALLNLEVLRTRQPNLAMASNGGSLFKRIKRITGAETRETRVYSRSLFVGLLTLTFILLLSTSGNDEMKASVPAFNMTAPELAWEQTPPFAESETDTEVSAPDADVSFVTDEVAAKAASFDPIADADVFPMTAYLALAKDAGQHTALHEISGLVSELGEEIGELGQLVGKDLFHFISNQVELALDTPVSKITLLENGEEIVIAMDASGNVESVEVDGRAVPESEYPMYKDMAAGTMHGYLRKHGGNVPPPPAPPVMGNMPPAPTPPTMGNMPPAPTPPAMGAMPTPPAPPARGNMSDEEYERAMEKFGRKMERWGDKLEASLEDMDWEKFERDMEEWGENLERHFESKDWKKFEKDMEAWGENFAEQFNSESWEDFGEAMAEWGEEFGEEMEEWGEELAERMERRAEEIEDREERRRDAEERRRDAARDRADRERDRERERARADRYRDRAERYRSGVDNIQDALEDDDLVKKDNSYKMRINEDELYVNGKQQSASMHRKYLRIVERSLGIDIDDEWVEINQKKRSTKTKISN